MQYIEKYISDIVYIERAYHDPALPSSLKDAILTDLKKTMAIGATLAVTIRFSAFTKFYLLKKYVSSAVFGSIFGVAYAPYFLVRKIDY